MKQLKDTVEGMLSEDYKERFVAEYQQAKIRYENVKNICNNIEVGKMLKANSTPENDCAYDLYSQQKTYMTRYLSTLEKIAILENIELSD